MQLVIAEKPSVARDLARVLGVRGTGRHALSDGAAHVITWCIGHLVELEEPAAYDPRWKAWRLDTLPMIPGAFKLRPVPGTRDQLRGGARAAARPPLHRGRQRLRRRARGRAHLSLRLRAGRQPAADAAALDLVADRRGDPAGVRGAAAGLPNTRRWRDAARCRSEADWLVGMNATRAVTLGFRAAEGGAAPRPTASRSPEFAAAAVYSIGRVQTPTLAIIVRREQAIRAFQPRDYWEVRGTFASTRRQRPDVHRAVDARAAGRQGQSGHAPRRPRALADRHRRPRARARRGVRPAGSRRRAAATRSGRASRRRCCSI